MSAIDSLKLFQVRILPSPAFVGSHGGSAVPTVRAEKVGGAGRASGSDGSTSVFRLSDIGAESSPSVSRRRFSAARLSEAIERRDLFGEEFELDQQRSDMAFKGREVRYHI